MRKLITSLLLILIIVGYGFAQSPAQRPLVSVIGEAEMSISPDQVLFTLEVITLDRDLSIAKKANDASTAKTLSVARTQQIPDQDIQTVNLTITPKYINPREGGSERIFVGYEITKRILITLKDLNRIDNFLGSVLGSGVNRVVGVSFKNSQIRKYREHVRAMAVKNAQEKAEAYAKRLGQNIGKAYSITEEGAEGGAYGGGGTGGGGGYGETEDSAARQSLISSVVTFAVGQIKIEERVVVRFLLE